MQGFFYNGYSLPIVGQKTAKKTIKYFALFWQGGVKYQFIFYFLALVFY